MRKFILFGFFSKVFLICCFVFVLIIKETQAQPTNYYMSASFGSSGNFNINNPITGIENRTFQATSTNNTFYIEWDSQWNEWYNTSINFNEEFTLTFHAASGLNNNSTLSTNPTSGNYYTIQIEGLAYSDRTAVLMETDNAPQSFHGTASTALSTPSIVAPGQNATINVTLAGNKSSQEKVFVRYSTDNWSTSKVTEATGSGTEWSNASASIPGSDNSAGTTVRYYAYSTTVSATNSSKHDLITLKLANNSGGNYSYTVQSFWTTKAGASNWSSADSWDAGEIPASGQPVTIEDNLTLDQDASVSSLTINSDKTFTASDATARTLTISSGGTLTNNGTLTAGTGKIVFSGNGSVAGTSATTFYNLEIAGGVVVNGNSTIGNKFTINSGGYLSQTPGGSGIVNESNIPNYSTGATLAFTGTFDVNSLASGWGTTGSKFPSNIAVEGTGGLTLSLTRSTQGNFDVATGATLNANGNLTISSSLTGTGSLITNGTVTGNVTCERYIAGYPDATHGWHLLSSPVGSFSIDDSEFNPGTSDDLFGWDEVTGYWKNHKLGNPSQIFPGEGYLVAYDGTPGNPRKFTGALNNSDFTINNLSFTESSTNTGWHLFGNPYPCALQWNATSWNLTDVNTTAKIWNSGNASYTDISANGIIPAMQGFMIYVTDGSNSITIPKADRTHNSQAWYKDTELNKLVLTVYDIEGSTSQESIIKFNENSTSGFDNDFDSYFLSGYAPQFYSSIDGKSSSTNTLPFLNEELTVPLYFIKNNASAFTLKIEGLETLEIETPVFLTDTKTNQTINFIEVDSYSFISEEGDSPSRFILHFKSTGISENNTPIQPLIYLQNSQLNIKNLEPGNYFVRVSDMTGRQVVVKQVSANGAIALPLSLQTGIYIVEVSSETSRFANKIFIK